MTEKVKIVKNTPYVYPLSIILSTNLLSYTTLFSGLRIRLTPTFTSGKMKFMFGVVKECAEEYQQSLEKSAARGISLDFKELSAGYTIEVINSTAFGLKTNSIGNPDSEFKKIGHLIFQIGLRFKVRRVIHEWFPFLKRYIRIGLFDKRVVDFFFRTVRETVEYRKKTNSTRNDFLQLLITLNEGHADDTGNTVRKENVLGK